MCIWFQDGVRPFHYRLTGAFLVMTRYNFMRYFLQTLPFPNSYAPKFFSAATYYLRNMKSYELQILRALSHDRLQQKSTNNFERSSRGCSQRLLKYFRASMYRFIAWSSLCLVHSHWLMLLSCERIADGQQVAEIISNTSYLRNNVKLPDFCLKLLVMPVLPK